MACADVSSGWKRTVIWARSDLLVSPPIQVVGVEEFAEGKTVGGFRRREFRVGGPSLGSHSESDEVDARERVVDLLHRAACCQITEVDRREARVLEQRDDLCFPTSVVAGDEDDALAARFVWIRAEYFGAQCVGSLDDARAPATRLATLSLDVLPSRSSAAQSLVASMTI